MYLLKSCPKLIELNIFRNFKFMFGAFCENILYSHNVFVSMKYICFYEIN